MSRASMPCDMYLYTSADADGDFNERKTHSKAPKSEYENYFNETEISKWSLPDFLEWNLGRITLNKTAQHGAFFALLKRITLDEDNARAKKAQELINDWKNARNSKAVDEFWKVWGSEQGLRLLKDYQLKRKGKQLEAELCDFNYHVDRLQELNKYSNLVGQYRQNRLKSSIPSNQGDEENSLVLPIYFYVPGNWRQQKC
ncbi:hypothetical protein BC936DRAFT_136853 [Jimgerdemannia flammicorona]|uniref:Uncharacterized protein n=1 Tax=Jimgerdemannia flammicorona TaxID=994334 RepID=A0A433CYN7_9FUNG|nr:hypothetical protein BC936DRAFT_136853 [Jimgerdemannia flammicorona]